MKLTWNLSRLRNKLIDDSNTKSIELILQNVTIIALDFMEYL